MRLRSYVRNSFVRITLTYAAFVFLTFTLLDTIKVHNAIVRSASTPIPHFSKHEKIFISSIHWTDEFILVYHWIPALLELVKEIGKENVFVSIAESGSLDNTKDALRWLDQELEALGVERRIVLDEESHLDVISQQHVEGMEEWILAPHGEWEVRRIPYLARERNKALEPLFEGEYDKVLFLNDVVFNITDVKRLLATRGGEYGAACSLDFKSPGLVYDTMALRDAEGYEPLMLRWPFFRAKDSREAIRRNEAVPVTSCWNGIVVMDAQPFYSSNLTFRGVTDDLARRHIEGSECCLIHPDNPLSQSKGVWVNPNVRVGYGGSAYDAMNRGSMWVSSLGIFYGSWMNWVLRLVTRPSSLDVKLLRRLVEWEERDEGNREVGAVCLIDEMQILMWNGWAHV